jgi:uncharacterized membrane protein
MAIVERVIDVDVPVSTAYNAWAQLELFPLFMSGVEEVRRIDDRHVHWRARIFGVAEEWDAEIIEQIPSQRIAWRSRSGVSNAGTVTFHRLAQDRSRIMLQIVYEPERLSEKLGDALGLVGRQLDASLACFKAFVEQEGARIEGTRHVIHAGEGAGAW